MANRLANETSPYLLQHADNPVDWYPWGPEALERARREDKPILLSIGYAACHWCHVMAHESFEDAPTALLMNDRFISIKVDREERPDLDSIYMQAVHAMTGHGGWPMTVVLTPDGTPFFGGTYFPKEERHGMPSFVRVLNSVSNAYQHRREDVARTTASVQDMYAAAASRPAKSGDLTRELLDRATAALRADFDATHGGFGRAPKFPPTMVLEWLLAQWARTGDESALEMVRSTFLRMGRGGLYDQVGGGFARYAVDAEWLVPHFEKMLYDNALLIRLGAHLWQATGDLEIRRVTEETIQWVATEMTAPGGGFFSSFDADSEGEEGKFYVWTATEFSAVVGEHADLLAEYWGVTPGGNFEGANILHVVDDPALFAARHRMRLDDVLSLVAMARRALFAHRATRVMPGRDEKILASWNGLMIRALAEAARAFDRPDVAELAARAATFAFSALMRGGRVLRSAKGSDARIGGFLEDYASLGLAALAVYELTCDAEWLTHARRLGTTIREIFWDDGIDAVFDTAVDQEPLVLRPRDVQDNAIPSGTSLSTELLLRLGTVFGDAESGRLATRLLETVAEPMARYPLAFGNMLCAADMMINGAIEVALVGTATGEVSALATAIGGQYVPSLIQVAGNGVADAGVALLRDRPAIGGLATAYVCRGYSCGLPTTDVKALQQQLSEAVRPSSGPAKSVGIPIAPDA